MKYVIDVSHHQNPATLPWDKFAAGAHGLIARASYGTMRDERMVEHLRRARGAGLKVGVYHFFRISQPAKAQFDVLLAQLDLAKIGSGDIVPTLDIELDPIPSPQPVTRAWQDGVRAILAALKDRFGNAMVYITQREFGLLGAPEWLLTFPLFVAHYTAAAKPATPGNRAWTGWQHRVAPFVPDGPGGYDKAHPDLDQSRFVDLPLIGLLPYIPPVAQPEETNESDDGLEDAIEQHNQALLDNFVLSEAARIERTSSSQAIREYEEAGLIDEPTGGGTNGNA
jgi:hypothetical protein